MIGYLYNENCYEHDTKMHLEVYERCQSIDAMVQKKYDIIPLPIVKGDKKDLLRIHDESYVDWMESAYEKGIRMILSADTIVSEGTYETALIAATSTKSVIDFFKRGGNRAFLNLRPPGHHAEIITGQGFCIFNNIAMMTKYAQDAGYKKVLIIDFDVHHGNGTQDIFYDDSSVFYFSTHEENNYPFTGSSHEVGRGDGVGFNQNIPYHDMINDEEFVALFDALPKDFNPDIVLVSAGYDLIKYEKISSAQVTFDGLEQMIRKVVSNYHDKPIAFVLEGGYTLASLVKSVDVTLEVLSESAFS
jgi:acetoin utilization deacetylase AcuC-like enzyme